MKSGFAEKYRFVIMSMLAVCLCLSIPATGAAKEKLGQSITITTGAVGGSWYPIGGALSELLNREFDGSPVSSVPGGGTANPKIVSQGKADVGLSYSTTLASAEAGTDPYDKPMKNLRAVALLYDMAWHVITKKSSKFDSFKDIAQNKIPIKWVPNKKGTGDEYIAEKTIQEYGFTYDDIRKKWGGQVQFVSMGEAVSLFRDGHINLYSSHTLPPQPTFMELATTFDCKFLSLEEPIRDGLVKKYSMKKVIIPAGTYNQQNYDVKTVGMPCVLFVRENVPDKLVYMLTKKLIEEQKYLISVHSLFKEFKPAGAWKDTGIKLHPAAEKYYREAKLMK